jgi:[acyl-carrier-protein] S-malonyltransferase
MGKQVLLFSGQGSQYKGMFSDYIELSAEAKSKIEQADKILGFPISEIMADMDSDRLTETRYTQPALYIHSTLAYDYSSNELDYSAVAGHSVGELAALYAAGVFDWETGLKLVAKRGELMFRAGEKRPGTMFAVVGAEDDEVVKMADKLTSEGSGNIIVAANFNSPGQVVISGSQDYLRENAAKFKEAGAKLVKELNVSGAFHSPLLEEAKDELGSAIDKADFNEAKVDVYQNIDAKPHRAADEIKNNLKAQLTGSVRWTQTLHQLESDGFTDFVEIGPGKVLQGLVKRTLSGANIRGIDKYSDVLNFNTENE